MKTAKMTLMFLACSAAIPAFAQNTTDSQCGTTNFDRNRGVFTILNPGAGTANQQCFITVVPKESWAGGAPDLSRSQLVEGNYEVMLSGGGGGGGGSARRTGRGYDGGDAIAFKDTRYLTPGVYRLTIGSGGQGGVPCVTEELGGRGGDGAPTSLSNAYSGETVAGFPRAEYWDGRYAQSYPVASARRIRDDGTVVVDGNMTPTARNGDLGGGGRGGGSSTACETGAQGVGGFIKLALADPVREPASQPAPQAAPARTVESVTPPAPATTRPARRDRN